MSIVRNSAKCLACGEEIESRHRHDFVAHYCAVNSGPGEELTFAVDGGRAYLRRVGSGWVETSILTDDAP